MIKRIVPNDISFLLVLSPEIDALPLLYSTDFAADAWQQLLYEYTVAPLDTFLSELGVSRATFKRDLEYLRGRLNAPIEWDRDMGGYRFIKANLLSPKYELPGLWFNASEIHALLTMRHLFQNLGPGLLSPHVDPLLARLKLLLESADIPVDSVEKRIRILRMNARSYEPEHLRLSRLVSGCLVPLAQWHPEFFPGRHPSGLLDQRSGMGSQRTKTR